MVATCTQCQCGSVRIVATGEPVPGPTARAAGASRRAARSRWGPILVGTALIVAFLIAQLPVSDLHAAEARAGAAANGVGPLYWLSWFGGSSPAQYSVLTPILSGLLSAPVVLAAATFAIIALAEPVLAGSSRPRSAAYFVVAAAVANLWSGRLAFSVGVALAMAALLLLRRRRPLLGAAVNVVAGLASPLGPAFLLLGLAGVALSRRESRRDVVLFGAVSVIGLALPVLAFGAPGPMPFMASTMVWTLAGILIAACVPMKREQRIGLLIAAAAVLACYLVPNGVGSNIQRYAVLVVPPLVWATSTAPRRVILLGLLPALSYCVFNLGSDLSEAIAPAAQASYYDAVRAALVGQPSVRNHRVEVIDTATHAASAALVPAVYLARGWEDHSDIQNNPIFYTPGALTARSYRQWLDTNAVSLIAVPDAPAAANQPEHDLVTGHVQYLHLVWHDAAWRVYAVTDPVPIVSSQATLVDWSQSSMTIDVAASATVTIKVRPSRYLQLSGPSGDACLSAAGDAAVAAQIATPGVYRLSAALSLGSLLEGLPVLVGGGPRC
jgi:hypothetical protein